MLSANNKRNVKMIPWNGSCFPFLNKVILALSHGVIETIRPPITEPVKNMLRRYVLLSIPPYPPMRNMGNGVNPLKRGRMGIMVRRKEAMIKIGV